MVPAVQLKGEQQEELLQMAQEVFLPGEASGKSPDYPVCFDGN